MLPTTRQVADALSLMVDLMVGQCPHTIDGFKDLCRLLQTSTAIRAALRRSRGRFTANIAPENVPGFAAWLPGHAGLVQELDVERDHIYMSVKSCYDPDILALSINPDLARLSCSLAAALRAASSRAPELAAAALGPSHCPPLQLVKYSSSCLATTKVAAALPTSLTSLDFESMSSVSLNAGMAGLGAALAQLPSLQSLRMSSCMDMICDTASTGLPSLTRLTSLEGATFSSFEGVPLPASLRQLHAFAIDIIGNADLNVDLSPFSGLRHVDIECAYHDWDEDMASQHIRTTWCTIDA